MPGQHAKLSPSGSKIWMHCTASPLYCRELNLKSKDSAYSIEGTEAHDWASKVLLGQTTIRKVPEEFRPHIADYVDVCNEAGRGKGERYVESKVPLFYSPAETGTVDFAFAGKDRLEIRDLKYGKGVPVDAEENSQLSIYSLSMVEYLEDVLPNFPDSFPVRIGIHQPRYRGDDPLKLWDTTVKNLRDFGKKVRGIVKLIEGAKSHKELTFAPSPDTCQFCPARGICKARAADALKPLPLPEGTFTNLDEQLEAMPDKVDEIETHDLEDMVALWRNEGKIIKLLKDVKEYLLREALEGRTPPGTKLVQGRQGDRVWRNEDEVGQILEEYLEEDELWKRTLVSPAAAEKLLKGKVKDPKNEVNNLVTRSDGKPVLATEDDKRPALEGAADIFSVLPEEGDEE